MDAGTQSEMSLGGGLPVNFSNHVQVNTNFDSSASEILPSLQLPTHVV